MFQELNADQQRETTNSRQRLAAFRHAEAAALHTRGSMGWHVSKGRTYLIRSSYDQRGRRKQTSLGVISETTEALKANFDRQKAESDARLASLRETLDRQAAVNRVLGLGRMPLIGARIVRALDAAGLLGSMLRIVGTNALYAYEAAAGIHLDASLTTTEDIDLLFDSRSKLIVVGTDDDAAASLLHILQKVDRSFVRTEQTFRAVNQNGYLVDLIRPLRNPPWRAEKESIGSMTIDLQATQIEGLVWLESAPHFESMVIDQKGQPLRMIVPDPRIFAAHKLWLSRRDDRHPTQKSRDALQARAIGALVATYLPHLQVERKTFQMMPEALSDSIAGLFVTTHTYRP